MLRSRITTTNVTRYYLQCAFDRARKIDALADDIRSLRSANPLGRYPALERIASEKQAELHHTLWQYHNMWRCYLEAATP